MVISVSKMFVRFLLCICFLEIHVIAAKTDLEIKSWFFSQVLECNKDSPLTPEELQTLHEHKMPGSKNARCVMACVFKRAKLLDSNGNFDVETSIAIAQKDHEGDQTKIDNASKLMKTCQKVNDEKVTDGDAGCDRAKYLFECFIEHAPKMGIPLH